MAKYTGQKSYENIGDGIQLSPIYAIGKPDSFLNILNSSVDKLNTAREKVGDIEQTLQDAFGKAIVHESEQGYVNNLKNKALAELNSNPFNVSFAKSIAGKYANDKGLVGRIKHYAEWNQYIEKINNLQDVDPETKRWWIATHPYKYKDVYKDNDNTKEIIGGAEFQYTDKRPLADIKWAETGAKLFGSILNPSGSDSDRRRSNFTDGDGTSIETGGSSRGVTAKRCLQVMRKWAEDPNVSEAISQSYTRDIWLLKDYDSKLNQMSEDDEGYKELKEKRDYLANVLAKTRVNQSLEMYSAYKLGIGSFADEFSWALSTSKDYRDTRAKTDDDGSTNGDTNFTGFTGGGSSTYGGNNSTTANGPSVEKSTDASVDNPNAGIPIIYLQ